MAGGGAPILKFSPDGSRSTFANGLHGPDALGIDATGNVYVAEATAANRSNHVILKFDPVGTESTFTSALGAGWDWGLAVDRSGNVFVWTGHAILTIRVELPVPSPQSGCHPTNNGNTSLGLMVTGRDRQKRLRLKLC